MKNCLSVEQSAALIKRGVNKDKASAAVIYLDYAGEEVEPHNIFKREGDGVLLTRLRNGTVIGVESKIVLKDSDSNYSVPIFTLADLLSLLPKEIAKTDTPYTYNLQITWHDRQCKWVAMYIVYFDAMRCNVLYKSENTELCNALYELIVNLLDNHVKLD